MRCACATATTSDPRCTAGRPTATCAGATSGLAATSATRAITISSATKYVNVTQGDVVKFDVDGKTFTWQFDTLRANASFDFSAIAPSGANTHGIRVYVAPNPTYAN